MKLRDHLTKRQVRRYASKHTDDASPADSLIEQHVASCALCLERILESGREQLGVLEPGRGNQQPTPSCPSDDLLQALAAGVCPPKDASEIIEHLADCNYCAPLLKIYLDSLEEEPVAGPVHPQIVFDGPDSWFKRLLHRPVKFKLAWAAGLAVLTSALVIISPTAINAYKLRQADRLLAKAFQNGRPGDMRVTWAPYGELDLKKGDQRCEMIENRALLDAAGMAFDKENSSDPHWIRVRGRVHLLSCKKDTPDLLKTAEEKGLNDPSMDIDLAVAYFQNATGPEGKGDPSSLFTRLGPSLELLNKVLQEQQLSEEQKKVALFDLAVLYETRLAWDMAVTTWEKYLLLDLSGPWHNEAQRRLEEARTHPNKAKSNLPAAQPSAYRDPVFFLHNRDNPEVLERLEDYQDIALRKWLLHAGTSSDDGQASQALAALATLLNERHSDPWLKDFLNALGPGDLDGVQALAKAINSNKIGQYTDAQRQAQKAAALFIRSQNSAGSLRARFEEVYANQRTLGEGACLKQAQRLAEQLLNTRYGWLQAQIALTDAVCQNFRLNFRGAMKDLDEGAERAKKSHFTVLQLRAQALQAAMWVPQDCNVTWQLIEDGLEQYWEGPSFPQRLYEFYSAAKQCFELNHLWYAAEAFEKQMIDILENEIDRKDENVVLEATAHRALAQILRELNDETGAQDQAQSAIDLARRVDGPTAALYEVPIQVELATMQMDRGDIDEALATLDTADGLVMRLRKKSDSELMQLSILSARGDIDLHGNRLAVAESVFKDALVLAERGFRSRSDKQRRLWAQTRGDIYRGLVEVFLEQGNDTEALQLWEWYQERPFSRLGEFAETSADLRWEDIERVILRQPIPPLSDTRLIYVIAKDRLHIWKIGSGSKKPISVPVKREELGRWMLRLLQDYGNPQNPHLPPASDDDNKMLFSKLIEPVVADLPPGDTVVIDMDQALKGFPLESLRSPEGWYFGERYPVIYSPGYVREHDLRPPIEGSPHAGIVLSAWTGPSERSRLMSLFPDMQVVDDETKTPPELQTSLENADMFVFLGHGKSGSLMRRNGEPLTFNFPPRTLKNLRLAVLSACSTGSLPGGVLNVESLVDYFQSGGTSSVIASQWDVDASRTTSLMESFYSHLKEGKTPALALYEARKETSRKDGHGHPYYWAGFVLYGRPN